VSDEIDEASGAFHTSVSPVVADLRVDPSTVAAISRTLSTERPRRWLGPVVVMVALAVVFVVALIGSSQTGVTPGIGTPAPSF
jgi:hypothetical protein